MSGFNELTGKEEAICYKIFDCPTVLDLAHFFNCKANTIRTQLGSIYAKLNIHTRDELIAAVAKHKINKEKNRAKKLRAELKKIVNEMLNPPLHNGEEDWWYLSQIKEGITKRNEIIMKAYKRIKELEYAINL